MTNILKKTPLSTARRLTGNDRDILPSPNRAITSYLGKGGGVDEFFSIVNIPYCKFMNGFKSSSGKSIVDDGTLCW